MSVLHVHGTNIIPSAELLVFLVNVSIFLILSDKKSDCGIKMWINIIVLPIPSAVIDDTLIDNSLSQPLSISFRCDYTYITISPIPFTGPVKVTKQGQKATLKI